MDPARDNHTGQGPTPPPSSREPFAIAICRQLCAGSFARGSCGSCKHILLAGLARALILYQPGRVMRTNIRTPADPAQQLASHETDCVSVRRAGVTYPQMCSTFCYIVVWNKPWTNREDLFLRPDLPSKSRRALRGLSGQFRRIHFCNTICVNHATQQRTIVIDDYRPGGVLRGARGLGGKGVFVPVWVIIFKSSIAP